MKHVKAIGIKFIIVSLVVFSLFGIFTNVSLMILLWMSLVLTGIDYVVGDLLFLRRLGNLKATILDFGLVFITVWILANVFIDTSPAMTLVSFYAAFILTLAEPLFHGYMEEKVFEEERAFPFTSQFQTEFAEEIDPNEADQDHKSESKK
ncbi:YndM family protein [Virgibacillus sp. W0430]|uniref:YndM family protein n=1 Tax=Virgibacillus sp. W0430 TaxID=3391580 RepID=UPI003F478224